MIVEEQQDAINFMKKFAYLICGLLVVAFIVFMTSIISYRNAVLTARTMAAFENVFEAQNLYLENKEDTIRGVLYIEAVINYEIWRKKMKNQQSRQRVINVKEFSNALNKHGEAYADLFKTTTVYSIGEGMLFIGVRESSEGLVKSTIKNLRYQQAGVDFVPRLGMSGDEVVLDFARQVERKLTREWKL